MSRASDARAALRRRLQELHRDVNKTMAGKGERPIPLSHVAVAFDPDGTSSQHDGLTSPVASTKPPGSDAKPMRLAEAQALAKVDPVAGLVVRLTLERRYTEADKTLSFYGAGGEARSRAAAMLDVERSRPLPRGRPSPAVEPYAVELHHCYTALRRWGFGHEAAVHEVWCETRERTGVSEIVTGRRISGYQKMLVGREQVQTH